jgi:hypothetical protein
MFVRNQNNERGGWLNVKIHILFYGDNSSTVAFRRMKFGTEKRSWTSLGVLF